MVDEEKKGMGSEDDRKRSLDKQTKLGAGVVCTAGRRDDARGSAKGKEKKGGGQQKTWERRQGTTEGKLGRGDMPGSSSVEGTA